MPDASADVVVVGGGSAGCIAASAFADAGATVLLLEAGPVFAAGSWPAELLDPSVLPIGPESGYIDAILTHLTPDASAWVARGRVLGGSGAVNGAYFVRALAADFDAWPQDHWSWRTVREFYCRSETDLDFGGSADHGDRGPMPVSRSVTSPLALAFTEAAVAAGHSPVADLNASSSGDGVGPVPANVRGGVRVNTAAAFLGSSAVTVRGGARVAEVLFDGTRAVGVRGRDSDGDFVVHADRVVLAAGALRTPLLLLHSGIGPAPMLRENGIEVLVESAGVGRGFADHPEVAVPYRPVEPASPAEGTALQTVLHTDEVEIRPYTTSFDRMIAGLPAGDPIVGVAHMTPRARGRIALASADPFAPPRVDCHYLEDASDRRALESGVEVVRALLSSPQMASVVQSVSEPASLDARLGTSIHLTGSARMGADDDPYAVVDSRCAVRGTTGLAVVDGSMFPFPVSRGPHATVVMAALRASSLLLGADPGHGSPL